MKRAPRTLVVGLVALSMSFALTPSAMGSTLTIEDSVGMVTPSSPVLSPDGESLVYVLRTVDWSTGRYNTDLWSLSLTEGDERRLTYDAAADDQPQWAPDGEAIAFLSSRSRTESSTAGIPQIYRLDARGGEAERLTALEKPLRTFRYSPDGTEICYLIEDPATDTQQTRTKRRDDAIRLGEYQHTHLHCLDLESRHTTRLTRGDFSVNGFDQTADGSTFVLTIQPRPTVPDNYRTDLVVLRRSQSEGAAKRSDLVTLVEQEGADASPQISPDGALVAFLTGDGRIDWAGDRHLAIVPLRGGPVKVISRSYNRTPRTFEWLGNDALVFAGPFDSEAHLYRLDLNGTLEALTSGAFVHTGTDFVTPEGGELVAVSIRESLAEPPDVWHHRLSGPRGSSSSRLTDWGKQFEDRVTGEVRVLRWQNPDDGLEIEGLLTLPPDYEPSARVPLLTFAHGGPASFFDQAYLGYLHYIYPAHSLAAEGFAVFRPNPRGSGAYGEPFKQANRSDWGGADYVDIQSGIDHLIELGIADPERLGFMGWSYGGFMTSWTITQTHRFKAASIGAPVTDLFSFQGSADIPGFLPSYFEGLPYERREVYEAHNPMSHVENVKTPALIQHGANDLRVPLFQGQIYYQALVDLGVPTEMIVYPRTPHAPVEPRLRVDTAQRNVWWFRKWLLGDERTYEEMFAPPEAAAPSMQTDD